VIAGALAAGAVALLLGLPILRLRGVFLAIATIGFGEVVRIAIVNTDAVGGSQGYRLNTGAVTVTAGFWEIYAALLALVYFFTRLKGSRMGLALEAIREDESASRTIGINVSFYKVAAYATGGAIAGVAGALYAHSHAILLAVVGGTFAWRGAILGAFLMTILSEVLRAVPPIGGIYVKDYPEIFSGLILLAVILFLPNGLLSAALGINRLRSALRPATAQAGPDTSLGKPSETRTRGREAGEAGAVAAPLDDQPAGKEQEPTRTGAGPREDV
jgi:branched-chain amino acid transport system permease protein